MIHWVDAAAFFYLGGLPAAMRVFRSGRTAMPAQRKARATKPAEHKARTPEPLVTFHS
jgi:hypothetical protein